MQVTEVFEPQAPSVDVFGTYAIHDICQQFDRLNQSKAENRTAEHAVALSPSPTIAVTRQIRVQFYQIVKLNVLLIQKVGALRPRKSWYPQVAPDGGSSSPDLIPV